MGGVCSVSPGLVWTLHRPHDTPLKMWLLPGCRRGGWFLATVAPSVPRREEICAIDDTDNVHKNKMEFNRKQLQVAKIEAMLGARLLPGEITHELCELAEEHAQSVSKAQRERVTTYNRKSVYVQKGENERAGQGRCIRRVRPRCALPWTVARRVHYLSRHHCCEGPGGCPHGVDDCGRPHRCDAGHASVCGLWRRLWCNIGVPTCCQGQARRPPDVRVHVAERELGGAHVKGHGARRFMLDGRVL